MIVSKNSAVEKQEINMEGVEGTSIQWLIGEQSEAPNFYLRLFEIEPGGHTPYHTHPWEHEVYFLEGEGQLKTKDGPFPVEKGHFALVMPDDEHQFKNTGTTPLKFLCIIPKEGK